MNTPAEAMQRVLGSRIRELRQRQGGQSREAFAVQCGLDAALLEEIERGKFDMTISIAAAIAANLRLKLRQCWRALPDIRAVVLQGEQN